MSSPENVKLTSSEMGSLWDAYINHTHNICVLEFFKAKAEDDEVSKVLDHTYKIAIELKEKCKQKLQSENIPVPTGFSQQDVDVSAPRLFPDSFALMYIKNMSRVMVAACGLMYTMSTRKDIRELYHHCLLQATNVFDEVSDVLLEKGVYTRPPFIEPPKRADFIEDKDYLNGKNLFGDQRYLNSIEISHLFANIEANVIGNSISKAYGQTADMQEVREFMMNAGQLSEKIINKLTEYLTGSHLPAPMPSETQVYSSSHPPFSDRLMMYELSVLTAAGISDYASSLATSMRNDLKTLYMDLFTDTTKLGGKAEKLMIENHWLEQPPQQDKILY
ncbi:DUF3231 family protein [Cytobacillus sp. FJAT-54145]|uniref:DUF3231 family protein n=1 Tax=Cytobacillus spartinae TaxID=3299023 RepID=A0ABW6KF37_9BACI